MDEATISQTILSGLIGAIFLGLFIWGLVTGQFRNTEEASRRMLENNLEVDKSPQDMDETRNNPAKKDKDGGIQ